MNKNKQQDAIPRICPNGYSSRQAGLEAEKKEVKKLIAAKRPGGFLDFLPTEYLAREKMLNTITKTFRSYGFDFIETPIVEFNSILKGEKSDTGKQTFIISSESTKRESLGLRFDQTIPFARILASNPYDPKKKTGIQLPFKRMVVGPVFRGERPQQGRYRQFYQFDIDIAGSSSMMADAEIITLMTTTLENIGVKRFTIRINNRKIFAGFGRLIKERTSQIKNQRENKIDRKQLDRITTEIIRSIDKVDKIGGGKVRDEIENKLQEEFQLSESVAKEVSKTVKKFLAISGSNYQKLNQCEKIFSKSKEAQKGINELKEIIELLKAQNKEENIEIDFSIARGLDYYTGTVMETTLSDLPEFGSVFSGGRYNELVKQFTGKGLSVVGASIGIDRLFAALGQLRILNLNQKTSAEAMVLRLVSNSEAVLSSDEEYLKIAQRIRRCGIKTTVCFLDDTTFKSQFNFALNSGIKYVIIIGEDEFKNNTAQIKNLQTRKQQEISQDKIENYFKK